MISIKENIDLRKMTTFGLTAVCGRLIEFSEPETDLPRLDREGWLDHALLIGGGSNLLFTTPECALTVIHPVNNSVSITLTPDGHAVVTADAGTVLDDLCRLTSEQNLWGLENLSGIPGHIGGAAVQNVGAYGTEFGDIVDTVTCYSCRQHEFVTLHAADCHYGYRDSIFKHLPSGENLIVCRVTLKLNQAPTPRLSYKGLYELLRERHDLPAGKTPDENIAALIHAGLTPAEVRNAVISLRDSKLPDPAKTGSAGSFFKNPVVGPAQLDELRSIWEKSGTPATPLPYHPLPDGNAKLSAAWLIDKAGCKPLTHGGAALWQSQPLVLVNLNGQASGQDIVRLEEAVISRVREMFGVTLTPEVIHI